MATFPRPLPRIHEEQIVLTRHDAHNNYHCPDRSCPCWADEREGDSPSFAEDFEETGTHPPDCRCAWCSADYGETVKHAPWLW
jgi:hypothetical protein